MDMLGLLIQGAVGVQFRLGYSDRGDLQKGGDMDTMLERLGKKSGFIGEQRE